MKYLQRTFALCLVLAATVVLPGVHVARAQSVTPVPAPTIITTAPYTISAPGYYQLGANLNYNGTGAFGDAIITINASNVTLDFGGHYISGPVSNTATRIYGIYASERSNVLIQNGTVAYCFIGIEMTGNNTATTNFLNPRVLNMTVTKCLYRGIELDYAVTSEVSGCRVTAIGGSTISAGYNGAIGIFFYAGSGSTATNNTITGITAQTDGSADGISGSNYKFVASGNVISDITSPTGSSFGLFGGAFAVGNTISNAKYGLYSVTKYRGNLTIGCTTPFSGGTAVGSENN